LLHAKPDRRRGAQSTAVHHSTPLHYNDESFALAALRISDTGVFTHDSVQLYC